MKLARTLVSCALACCVSSCSRPPKSVAVPTNISTVAAGYPFARQLKDQIGPDANLTVVLVDFDRQGDRFVVPQVSYGFASAKTGGRIFVISVDNIKSQACVALDTPSSPKSPLIPASTRSPLNLDAITNDIPQILAIAKTNGLDEFCALASPKHGKVSLRLFNSESGPVWSVGGDGWDEKGPIADLAITIDARTGKVISHTIQKSVNPTEK